MSPRGRTKRGYLRSWITQPDAIDPAASMPAFGDVLREGEMTAIVDDLAARKERTRRAIHFPMPPGAAAATIVVLGSRAVLVEGSSHAAIEVVEVK